MPRDDGGGRRIVFERPEPDAPSAARSGRSWWSRRFLAALAGLGVGGRIERGAHPVADLRVTPGEVTATAAGHRVRIGLRPFADEAWEAVEDAVATEGWHAASLLAGEVPDDLETVFARVGLSLFPTGSKDLPMDCTCPDWSVPCEHLAAALHVLAERFDDDPFAILRWRGRDRATLLGAIRARRDDAAPAVTPLSGAIERFFDAGGPLPSPSWAHPPSDTLLDAMPPLGVRVTDPDGGEVDLRDALRALYQGFAVGRRTWPAS